MPQLSWVARRTSTAAGGRPPDVPHPGDDRWWRARTGFRESSGPL